MAKSMLSSLIETSTKKIRQVSLFGQNDPLLNGGQLKEHKVSEYRKGNTRMFNIRVPEYLHGQFKEKAQELEVSMANLLIGYMERVVNGEEEAIIKTKDNAEFDPLSDIRNQYKQGEDF